MTRNAIHNLTQYLTFLKLQQFDTLHILETSPTKLIQNDGDDDDDEEEEEEEEDKSNNNNNNYEIIMFPLVNS